MYDLNWDVIVRNWEEFAAGLALGLTIALLGLTIGTVIGLIMAFARSSESRPLRAASFAYVAVIRNIPILLLLFIFYFGLPIVAYDWFSRDIADRLVLDGPASAAVALSIYAGAYLTEIFRAGILAVSRGYLDAGRSLGLSRFGVVRYVTLPIMFRTVLPSLSNTFISLFKDTSLASAIAVHELTFVAREVGTDTFRVIEAWTTAGALYLATSYILALLLRTAERRIRWSV